ncbi:hypothetical protein ACP4OV_007715 [Aristida adscensionis]
MASRSRRGQPRRSVAALADGCTGADGLSRSRRGGRRGSRNSSRSLVYMGPVLLDSGLSRCCRSSVLGTCFFVLNY